MNRRDLLIATAAAGMTRLPGGGRARRVAGQSASAATPEAAPASADSLTELLRFVPALVLGALDDAGALATFADSAAQLAAVDVAVPASRDDPGFGRWVAATSGLALADTLQYAFGPEWREAFGWDGFAVDRSLQLGQPPATVTIRQGQFDRGAIDAALSAQGYATVEIPGAAVVWSRSPEPDFDLSSDVGRLALGSMNTVALLPDGTMVTGGVLAGVSEVVATATGGGATLADEAAVQHLLAAQTPPLVTAMLVPGSALAGGVDPRIFLPGAGTPMPDLDEVAATVATEAAARAAMPPVLLALLGRTAGGPLRSLSTGLATPAAPAGTPLALTRFALLLASPKAAEQAVPVIEERLASGVSTASGMPWSELMRGWRVVAIPDAPVVVVEVEADNPTLWYSLLFQRDLGFLAW